MEITKIFSDNQGSERLYTVLMSGDELKLYSEFKEMLKNSANPLKKIDYRKEDGTPDRIKNGLQSALTTAVWT